MPTTCSVAPQYACIPDTAAGLRLDVVLAGLFPEHSRSRLSGWIKSGAVRIDGNTARPRDLVQGGETITLNAIVQTETHAAPEAIALSILHEDDAVLVIDKPAGLVVHPGAGNPSGTLVNALLHHDPALAVLPRAGIVHRLDKDTSGVMVIARTLTAHTALVTQLAARAVKRQYLAVITGALVSGGSVNAAIGRHPRDRLKMAVRDDGREAITHYRLNTRFRAHTALDCHLETGRTHQIRVHMAYLKHPIVGDPLYGGGLKLPRAASPELTAALRNFKRQALHAKLLEFIHPNSGKPITCTSPVPADLSALLAALETDTQAHGERQRQ